MSRANSTARPLDGYTQAQVQEGLVAWCVTDAVYGEDMRALDPAAWFALQAGWDSLRKHLANNRSVPRDVKNKTLAIQTMNYGQVIALGLPMLRRHVRQLLDTHRQVAKLALEKGHDALHAAVEDARVCAHDWLERYLICSMMMDDGLRLKQYRFGIWGTSFLPMWKRDSKGNIVGIAELRTSWTGDREDESLSLKMHFVKKRSKEVAMRRRIVRPGIVDLDLLWTYLTEVRHPRLIGSAPKFSEDTNKSRRTWASSTLSTAPFDAELDSALSLPLFFSERTGHAYSQKTFSSDRLGQGLHWIATRCLGRDVPAWGSKMSGWRAIWAAHITRLLIGSYWLLVRGTADDVAIATHLTMDQESTLRDHYAALNTAFLDSRTDGSFEDPHAYDSWVDRIVKHQEVVDPLKDPKLPLSPAARDLLQAFSGLSPHRRVRRARPGQAAPQRRRGPSTV